MRLQPLALPGLALVRQDRLADPRGWFARTVCAESFAAAGLPAHFPQQNASFNERRGTIRGLHWQAEPQPEGKLVRCVRGAVFDVAVDVRPHSPTFGRWEAVELTAENGDALWIPPGFAHGFQALQDRTELLYLMSAPYDPHLARGLRWDDPAVGIAWPLPAPLLSERDRALPGLDS